jgi:hypothetical protein
MNNKQIMNKTNKQTNTHTHTKKPPVSGTIKFQY